MKRVKKLLLILAFPLMIAWMAVPGDIYLEIAKNIDIFTRIYKDVTLNYVDNINPGEFLRAGIRGMLSALDPYTVFIDEKKQDDVNLMTTGKYGGVGISVGVRNDRVVIVEIMDGYSAQRQGIFVGDIMYMVDSVLITPKNYDDISSLVKGEPGTFVNMTILRGDAPDTLNFTLMREEIILKNVVYYGFYPENSGNAYIKLTGFSRPSGEEVKNAIMELKKKRPVESLIFDLRGNPGGLLDAAVDISSKFLRKGQLVVTTKGRDSSSVRNYYVQQEPLLPDVPMIILINGSSASASEIVAGALQDHDRALVAGTKSFGKGLVQTISPLSYNTSIKITTSRYYTPSGRSIQIVDYAKDSKVIKATENVLTKEFQTDNKRNVYSGGGIMPDTLMEERKAAEITRALWAKGYIFKFCNNYHNKNKSISFNDIKRDKLFAEFTDFLKSEKFEYESELVKDTYASIENLKTNKNYVSLQGKFDALISEVKDLSKNEINSFREEIVNELLSELAYRYSGTEGKIKKQMEYDTQLNSAVSIITDKTKFLKLLNNK